MTDKPRPTTSDRKLGDEWLDWDGSSLPDSSEAGYRLFVWFAALSAVVLTAGAGCILWLIYPRLVDLGTPLPELTIAVVAIFGGVLFAWVILFALSSARGRPVAGLVMVPRLVNRLLAIVAWLGRLLGISTDRLTNSFLKTHNALLGHTPTRVPADRLMVLAPRCLTKENNRALRDLRDRYGFELVIVGGGSDARAKIRQVRPEVVLAIACERDLLSGFKEVNPHVPVMGFPNRRPEGPCKNTSVDMAEVERMIISRLHLADAGSAAR